MPEKVNIPISLFEYVADFTRPVVAIWMDRAQIVQAMFDALIPWKLNIDNVEPVLNGKASEQGLNIRLPEKRVTFFFGPTTCKFTKDDADWASAEETINILTAATNTLKKVGGVEISAQRTSIMLHLQPKATSFLNILKPFLSPAIQALENESAMTGAAIVKWDKRRVILDGSAALANAVFLKFEREFNGDANFEDIALQLRTDEEAILRMLDVEEDI